MKQILQHSLLMRVVSLLSVLMISSAAQAASRTWDTVQGDGATITGGSGTWTDGGVNWNTGAGDTTWSNAAPDNAVFGGTAGTVTLGSNITTGGVTSILFNSSSYTIAQDAGGLFALTIGTGGVSLSTGQTATINAKLTGSNAWTAFRASGNGTLTIGGSVANDSTGTISNNLPGHLILAKSGGVAATAGNLILTNNPVHLSGGDQSIGGTTTFQTSTNSRLHPQGNTYTTRGLISGLNIGVIENSSTGFGTVPGDSSGAVKIITQSGDSFSYNAFLRNVETGGGQPAGQTMSVIKEGAGTQTFDGANINYTGTTSITGGTLSLANTSGFASATTVSGTGTLQYKPTAVASINSVAATVDLQGALVYNPGGAFYQTTAAAVTVNATSAINVSATGGGGGNSGLYLDGGLKGSSNLTVTSTTNGVGLVLRGGANNTYSGTMIVAGNASTAVGVGSGLVVGQNNGTATTMPNANITVNGTMEMGDNSTGMGWAANLTTVALSGKTFTMNALNGTGKIVGNMQTGGSTRTLSVGNNDGGGDFSGEIANGVNNTMSFVKAGAGTQALSGVNTYTGSTTISGGTLQISGAGQLGSGSYAGAISNNATLQHSSSANQTLSGAITGTGAVIKDTSSSTLTLSGSGTNYSGATTVNAGTLNIQGALNSASTITVNNTGKVVLGPTTYANSIVLTGGTVGLQDNVGSGGTIVNGGFGGNVSHTFTSTGTLVLPGGATANGGVSVGGGGGGGGSANLGSGGGGGGGGVIALSGTAITAGSAIVSVGAGGGGGTTGGGGSGTASSIAGVGAATASGGSAGVGNGGGRGGGASGAPTSHLGGGSSGGAAGNAGGGGGGALTAGGSGSGGTGGASGLGLVVGSVTYGTGGFGRVANPGAAGANTGDGGAGGGTQGGGWGTTGGGAGGTGLVIVQYPYSSTVNLSGSIDVQAASTLDATLSTGLLIVSGTMSTSTGTGGITIASSNGAGGVVRYDTVAKTYLGDTAISGGATLRMNVLNALPNGAGKGNVVLDGGATAGTLDLNNFDTAINGLDGTVGAVLGQVVNNGSAALKTLTLGNGDANGSFAGIVRDNTSGTGTIALTKTGSGTQTLSGTNTYTGPTEVNGGTLQLLGGTISGTSQITVGTVGSTATDFLVLDTNATYTLTTGDVRVGSTGAGQVDHNIGNATIGGDLSVGFGSGFTGVYNILPSTTATVTADNILVGSGSGTNGTLNVGPGATVNAGVGPLGDLVVGRSGGTGHVEQTGGTVNVNGTSTYYLGDGGVGTYDLNVGAFVDDGSGFIGTDSLTTGPGTGTFTHTGGTASFGLALTLGDVNAGSVGTYNMNTAATSLAVGTNLVVGGTAGTGHFNQSTGATTVTGQVQLGGGAGSGSTVALSGGSLANTGVDIGFGGGTGHTFTQSGGTHTTTLGAAGNALEVQSGGAYVQSGGTYNVAGPNNTNVQLSGGGTYTLSGGTLDFQDYVGAGTAWSPNNASTLQMTSGADFIFTGGSLLDVSDIVTGGTTFTQAGGQFIVGRNGSGVAALTEIDNDFDQDTGSLLLDVFGDDLTPEACCDGTASNNDQLLVQGVAMLNGTIALNFVSYTPAFGDVFTLVCADIIDLGPGFHIDGGFFRIVPATGDPNGTMALQALVPEPASIAVWTLVGLAGAAGAWRLRRKRK